MQRRDYDNRIFLFDFWWLAFNQVCVRRKLLCNFLFMNIYARACDSSSFRPAIAHKFTYQIVICVAARTSGRVGSSRILYVKKFK
jgi:hypothetical protein